MKVTFECFRKNRGFCWGEWSEHVPGAKTRFSNKIHADQVAIPLVSICFHTGLLKKNNQGRRKPRTISKLSVASLSEPISLRNQSYHVKMQCSPFRFIFMQIKLMFCTNTRFETEANDLLGKQEKSKLRRTWLLGPAWYEGYVENGIVLMTESSSVSLGTCQQCLLRWSKMVNWINLLMSLIYQRQSFLSYSKRTTH